MIDSSPKNQIRPCQKSTKNLQEDILNYLADWKTDESRENFKSGASISNIISHLRDLGWSFPTDISTAETILRELGFSIKPARTKNGFHQWNRVVCL